MSVQPQEAQDNTQEVKVDTSESNLVKQRKYYEKQLEQERIARAQAEERIAQIEKTAQERIRSDDDDTDDEPYVDHKRLEKKFTKFEARLEQKIDQRAEEKARKLMDEERRHQWLKNNPDFYEVMNHAQKFAEKDPELAETILEMPDTFDRQKLVYKNIKALNLHKKEEAKPSIQEVIDKNKRGPYYQPSGQGAPPYASASDFSPSGQKNAYTKMKELQQRLRG